MHNSFMMLGLFCMCMYYFISGVPEPSDALVTNQNTLGLPVVTGSSPVKNDSKTSYRDNQQANNDVNKPTVQFSDQQQQPIPPTKPENSPALNQQEDPALVPSLQRSSGPSNVTASNSTKVTTNSARPESGSRNQVVLALGIYILCITSYFINGTRSWYASVFLIVACVCMCLCTV